MDENFNQQEVHKVPDSFKKNRFILIFVFLFLSIFVIFLLLNKFNINSTFNTDGLLSSTRSISGVSNATDDLFDQIGFKNKILWGEIIKTKDNNFWFFSADNSGCGSSMSCTAPGYMIDVKKKTISNFTKSAVNNMNLIPVYNSLVITYTEPEDDKYRMVVFDSSINKIIDYIDYPIDDENDGILPYQNFLFVSDKYYIYSYKNVLYSRDIKNHSSYRIGNFYDPKAYEIDDMDVPMLLSDDGKTIYMLLYVNTDDTRPYYDEYPKRNSVEAKTPQKDDDLSFVAFNIEDNSTKIITNQIFNFPFIFKFISPNKVIIGGGSSGFGLKTYPTYLVDITTGKADIIYNGITNSIKVDDIKKTITINSNKSNQFSSVYSIIVFDYSGNILSKTDFENDKIVSTKNNLTNNTPKTVSSYPVSEYKKSSKPVVELFIASYDIFSAQIEKGIIPVLETLGNKIDFKLKFHNYIMNGDKEIAENLVQYCIREKQPEKLINYLKCFLIDGQSSRCLGISGVDKNIINSCVSTTDKQFKINENKLNKVDYAFNHPSFNVDKIDNEKYSIEGSGRLIINEENIQSDRDPASILKTICNKFILEPKECSLKLSSVVPKEGFGY